MIRQRVNAGLNPIKAKINRDGHFTTKAGIVRRRLGRPGADSKQIARFRKELATGLGIGKTTSDCCIAIGAHGRWPLWVTEQYR